MNNIGRKIQVAGSISSWVGVIASLIVGIYFGTEMSGFLGWIIVIGGGFFALVGSWLIQGFGRLVENSESKQYQSIKLPDEAFK